MPGHSIRARLFPLHRPEDVDALLSAHPWSVVFKAGTSDKTFEALQVVERVLEPRVDVPVGIVRLPADRPASDHLTARSGVPHRSPQVLLFEGGSSCASLDEFDITPDKLVPLLVAHLPAAIGVPVENAAVTTLEPYRVLLASFLSGERTEERFEWAWLERLERDAAWRDDETFALLGGLFENPFGRPARAAQLVAIEFQAQMAGRTAPLRQRATEMLERLEARRRGAASG